MTISEMNTTHAFTGEYRFLSNFASVQVVLDGVTYPSVENAYQAAKTLDLGAREVFTTVSAVEAKRLGKTLSLRDDWDAVKVDVMTGLLRQKFMQNHYYKTKLLATGDIPIVEYNFWGDTFWGVSRGLGFNFLGKILMDIRAELKEEE